MGLLRHRVQTALLQLNHPTDREIVETAAWGATSVLHPADLPHQSRLYQRVRQAAHAAHARARVPAVHGTPTPADLGAEAADAATRVMTERLADHRGLLARAAVSTMRVFHGPIWAFSDQRLWLLAGYVADLAGGTWLLTDPEGRGCWDRDYPLASLPDGTPVTPPYQYGPNDDSYVSDQPAAPTAYLLADDGDHPAETTELYGHRVIHTELRAIRLLDLEPSHPLMGAGWPLEDLDRAARMFPSN
ncbi:hypothetical protein [Bailinhaonella thermotolerans]|uniref:Uncharacterized protein n=1 Tax=Bailinhaonella thermotolerans TaxID=1070861 RepID=A0A3A4A004_9ACTN|nr:hypothetical protein [Bailinhaonella thermotolerans]RJL21038.1 hypothetical protein D5H75_38135 [Bailinhaonella thermotolerans]